MAKRDREPKTEKYRSSQVETPFALGMAFHVAVNAVESVKKGADIDDVLARLRKLEMYFANPRQLPLPKDNPTP